MAQQAASGVEEVVTMEKPASTAPKVVLDLKAQELRPGTADVFNSTHPRNMFAPKPTTATATVVPSGGPQIAIDWSSSGIPLEVNRSLIKAGTSSHLGLYQQASNNRIPTQYLCPATSPVQAARSQRVQAQGRPPMVKQMYAKGSRGPR